MLKNRFGCFMPIRWMQQSLEGSFVFTQNSFFAPFQGHGESCHAFVSSMTLPSQNFYNRHVYFNRWRVLQLGRTTRNQKHNV